MNLAIDVETTKAPNHFPWTDGQLCTVAAVNDNRERWTWTFHHNRVVDHRTQGECIREIQELINNSRRIVGHNLKFDLHWLRWIGIDFSNVLLFCTMVAEYNLRHHERLARLNLESLSKAYGIPAKKDKVKQYWDAGVDTPDIPHDILTVYGEQDTYNALAIFHAQVPRIKEKHYEKIISLEMETMRVFQEMEYNGMLLDKPQLLVYNNKYVEELEEINQELCARLNIDNPNSGDQLSKSLFGYPDEYPPIFDATKLGVDKLKKDYMYSTDVANLSKLRGRTKDQKEIIDLLYRRSRTEQMVKTYFGGLQKHIQSDNCIHPSINQTITKTSRASCSQPNLQNQMRGNTGPVKECFITRY